MFSSEGSAIQEYLHERMLGVVYRRMNTLPVATSLEKVCTYPNNYQPAYSSLGRGGAFRALPRSMIGCEKA